MRAVVLVGGEGLQRVAGRKARLAEWVDSTYIKISSDQLKFPTPGKRTATGQQHAPTDFVTLKTSKTCKDSKGKFVPATISLYVWDSVKDGTAAVYTSGFRDVRLTSGGGFAFVIAPKGTKIPKPPSMSNLAAPTDVASTASTTTVPATAADGASTTVPPSTVASSVASTVAPSAASSTTASPTTASPTTASPTSAVTSTKK